MALSDRLKEYKAPQIMGAMALHMETHNISTFNRPLVRIHAGSQRLIISKENILFV